MNRVSTGKMLGVGNRLSWPFGKLLGARRGYHSFLYTNYNICSLILTDSEGCERLQ